MWEPANKTTIQHVTLTNKQYSIVTNEEAEELVFDVAKRVTGIKCRTMWKLLPIKSTDERK